MEEDMDITDIAVMLTVFNVLMGVINVVMHIANGRVLSALERLVDTKVEEIRRQ